MSGLSTITVVIKDPPGGRCRLYLLFAEALATQLSARVESNIGPEAPALLLDGTIVAPADGIIVTADELLGSLAATCIAIPADLPDALEAVESRFMDEMGA